MRILFIADANATNASAWMEYFANKLGHDVHVIAMKKPERRLENVETHALATKTKTGYLFRVPQISRLVREIRPDILVGYRIQSYGFLAASTGFHPLVLAGQCESIVWPPDSRVNRRFSRYAISHADLIHAWSEGMARALLRLGARPEIVHTYPRGVRTDVFFPAKERPPSPAKTIIITRGLSPEYHHKALLQAVMQIKKNYAQELDCLILGDGPQRTSLESLAANSGLGDRIRLPGFLPQERVADYLRRSEVYVSLVSTDGVSASLLEAMACGIFPIVPDIPANRFWIHDGRNGFLLPMQDWQRDRMAGFLKPPDDYPLLAKKIVAALSDDELREEARAINLGLVQKKADWARNMAQMEESWIQLVQSGRCTLPAAMRASLTGCIHSYGRSAS
jgi:glycosyltransferase involved in cell wall biosynthesis